ncbi:MULTISPECIES: VOC family protein [unclassified Iodidimonas]|jgi:catechol 2,3-dioxygenase-like lactoylglutathione lyase family enzyme|uniref:VOC family protein n=1 Tax=unclassified Iodidimonas TaxID=2626145 RepID=UPI002482B363|nr:MULTISPECIES: VOC family protein [unclassified Iodidimonas]
MNLTQITLPTRNIEESADFYRRMGFLQIVDTAHYARFECENGATFSLHLDDRPAAGVTTYFETTRLDALVGELAAKGFIFELPPTDQRWLWREARLKDPAGNLLCLFNPGENRRFPPWRVERRG